MKYYLLLITLTSIEMLAQKQSTFIYELTLFDSYKHRSMWTEREYEIQKAHVAYLDSLEMNGHLTIAGILDQNLEDHTGFVILKTGNHEEALRIVENDPSVMEGMMTARLRPINIYFQSEE